MSTSHHSVAASPLSLADDEICRRAARLKLLLTDCDGVLTDAGVYYGATGEVMKRYSIRDGMGVERLRNAGIETGVMTGEKSGSLKQRAAKLQISKIYLGVRDKPARLQALLAETGLALDELAYIGDDVNDLGVMQAIAAVSLTATPSDGMPQVRGAATYICKTRGGHGAFRDFAEWILAARDVGARPIAR